MFCQKKPSIWVLRVKFYKTKGGTFQDFKCMHAMRLQTRSEQEGKCFLDTSFSKQINTRGSFLRHNSITV